MSLAVIDSNTRAEWLAERKKGIGASESPAALGLSPYATPLQLYLQKTGQADPTEETLPMRLGSYLEPLLAQLYTERTGAELKASQVFLKAKDHPFLFATLDAVRADGIPVEFKATGEGARGYLGEEGTDDLPEHWLIQAHQQMLVSEAERVDFGVLVGNRRFLVFPVYRDEQLVRHMVPLLRQFWDRVVGLNPPPAEFPRDRQLLMQLFPGCDGEISLGFREWHLCQLWEEAKAEAKAATDRAATLRDQLLEAVGNASVGHLPDGRQLRRRIVELKETTIHRKASRYVDLRIGGKAGE